jgi:hypothetical protein
VTEPAFTFAFHDTAQDLHGTVRSGMTLLFDRGQPHTIAEEARLDGVRAVVGDRVELDFDPVSEQVDLGGVNARVGRVRGTVEGRKVECLGVVTETIEPPAWSELDAVRTIAAVFDPGLAVLALARRERGVGGHGDEHVAAWLIRDGAALAVEDARISTIYDGDGRQRTAGLELWLPGEDFPRRASGTARAGASLTLNGLRVHAAVFAWRMEGRDGVGAYDIVVRDEPADAA